MYTTLHLPGSKKTVATKQLPRDKAYYLSQVVTQTTCDAHHWFISTLPFQSAGTTGENRVSRNSGIYLWNCCRNNQNTAEHCFLKTFHPSGWQLHILLTHKATLVPSHALTPALTAQHFIYNEKRQSTSPKALLCNVLTAETGLRSLSTIFTLKYS